MAVRVLIVEDETVLRKHLARMLARRGFDVTTAANRAEALDELSRARFETMLLDVWLPDGDGLDLLAGLSDAERPPHTVVMTACRTREDEERAGRLQVSRFLNKPLDLDQVVGAVRSQLPPGLGSDPQAP